MLCSYRHNLCILLYVLSLINNGLSFNDASLTDSEVLNVGGELLKETLPLKMGSRLYRLQGLKPDTWYEVKISYPASIPARFSIQLKKDNLNSESTWGRKLLNTEKIIFKTDADLFDNQGGVFVLVSVEPEGIVAIRGVQERENIIFNIVCDELLLGIPHKAWWVVILVVFCLVLALVISYFLPSYLLQSSQSRQSSDKILSKDS